MSAIPKWTPRLSPDTLEQAFFSTFSSKLSRPKTPKISKLSQNFCQNSQIFPAKISNFYYIRVLEKLTDLVKTQPNFKTQPKISPKLSFPATPVAVHAAQSLKKKAWPTEIGWNEWNPLIIWKTLSYVSEIECISVNWIFVRKNRDFMCKLCTLKTHEKIFG